MPDSAARRELVERVARTMCVRVHKDPDEIITLVFGNMAIDDGEPRWKGYAAEVELLLSVLGETHAVVPREADETLCDVGRGVTAAWLDIKGSGLTVAREKMRRRFNAMVAAADLCSGKVE